MNNNIQELAMIFCQLFFCIFLVFSCNTINFDDVYYKNYILEDQGAIEGDASFTFNVYSSDITGDKIIDHVYITTYMDNYFGYVFNGKTGQEIAQSGWINFISKPGREMALEFRDLNCNNKNEIIQYSIQGHENNKVYLDILQLNNDTLTNIFSKELTNSYTFNLLGTLPYQKPIFNDNCEEPFLLIRMEDSIALKIKNKIDYILEKKLKNNIDKNNVEVYYFNKEENGFLKR
ncbi:MAG: hypothetical protein ACI94Y_000522 [Maribacter sp.]|jgi:hypothetical protein